VALADIIRRIEHDTTADAATLVGAAEAEATRVRHEARASAKERRESELAHAERLAKDDARTRLASARLHGRDRVLVEKRELINRTLRNAIEHILALPDAEYAALLAREIDAAARGGETVALGQRDADRLRSALPAALEATGTDVEVAEATDSIEQGVVLIGTRMRVEISPAALVESHRAELEARVSSVLFASEETP